MKSTQFALRLEDFLSHHLPCVRNASIYTIKNYGYTFSLLLKFLMQNYSLKPEKINFTDLTPEIIIDFLSWLEQDRGNSVATRNQRLAAIHSFFRHVQNCNPELIYQCQRILSIQKKRETMVQPIRYLSFERVEQLLALPDSNTEEGLRDSALLSLLYDSGIRVEELCKLTFSDLKLRYPAHVSIQGKGRKLRIVPLTKSTCELLENYLKIFSRSKNSLDMKLFYNRQGKQLTRAGVRYILCKYTAEINTDGLCKNISPHTLRHSKAMHLIQAGVSLAVIQSILGHEDIKSTMIYARADLQMMSEALNKLPPVVPESEIKGVLKKPEIISWLKNLCKSPE